MNFVLGDRVYSQDAITTMEEAYMGDTGLYTDCAQGHTTERISGKDENEFVGNVKRHLGMIHKGMPMPTREDIMKMAKRVEAKL